MVAATHGGSGQGETIPPHHAQSPTHAGLVSGPKGQALPLFHSESFPQPLHNLCFSLYGTSP